MSVEQVSDRHGEVPGSRNVHVLVRAVSVRVRADQTGDHELGGGVTLAQHPHERDRATLAERAGRPAEAGVRGLVERIDGKERLPDGSTMRTTVEITPVVADPMPATPVGNRGDRRGQGTRQ